MRAVLISSAPPVAVKISELLAGLGHEVPAVVALRAEAGRYGADYPTGLHDVVPDADLLFVRSGRGLGALLRAYAPDVALCVTFPALIPGDALDAPRYGIVNGHPSLLPRLRGPNPLGWALRNGETQIGSTLHRMTHELDAGPILAQGSFAIDPDEDPLDEIGRNGLWGTLIAEALARVEAGDPGDPQDDSQATYAGRFEPGYVEVDWTWPAREIHNQTRAWSLAPPVDGVRGPLTTLGGERVRLVRTRLRGDRGGTPVQCGDGPLWILEAEPA